MFLKRKIDLVKKSLFLCLFLIMGSFAATLNAAEKAEFIINDDPFIFRNKKLIPTEKYTPQELQKKIGKADGSSNKENFIEIFYKDEGVAFLFENIPEKKLKKNWENLIGMKIIPEVGAALMKIRLSLILIKRIHLMDSLLTILKN